MSPYLKALEMKYEADIEVIQLNLKNYLDNAVAVAEHPNIVQDIDNLVEDNKVGGKKYRKIQGMF